MSVYRRKYKTNIIKNLILLNNITFYFYPFNSKLLINVNNKNTLNKWPSYIKIRLYIKCAKYSHRITLNINYIGFHPIHDMFIKLKETYMFFMN